MKFIFFLTVFSALNLINCSSSQNRDKIFYGGDILTLEDNKDSIEAIYVENGKIKSLGKKDDIFYLKNENTELIDLEGKTLLPGFIDIHSHPDITAYLDGFLDLSGFTNSNPQEVWNKLKEEVKNKEKGEWIFCKGFDPMLVPNLNSPSKEFLDEISPNNPVIIIAQSLHSAWANSSGFKGLGIDKNTPDPGNGSYYEKNNEGELTGFIAELEAMDPIKDKALEVFNLKKNVVKTMEDYSKKGVTTISTLGLLANDKKPLILFEHISGKDYPIFNKILVLFGILPPKKSSVRHFVYLQHKTPDLFPDSPNNGDDFYKIIGVKIWYDGSPYTGSMYLLDPYLDSKLMKEGLKVPSGSKGKAVISKDKFYQIASEYNQKGWQIAVHSQGDKAGEDVIEIFEKLKKESGEFKQRHRLEHTVLLPKEKLNKMKEMNITPSFHINHLYYYGKALKNDILGPKRANKILPVNSSKKNGLIFSLHADIPMYPIEPLSLVQTAVTRKTREGISIGDNEKISIEEGLKAITIYAAYQLNMENKIGSIKEGKYADFVILNKNPLKTNKEKLREIQIKSSYMNGEKLY